MVSKYYQIYCYMHTYRTMVFLNAVVKQIKSMIKLHTDMFCSRYSARNLNALFLWLSVAITVHYTDSSVMFLLIQRERIGTNCYRFFDTIIPETKW